MATEDSLSNSLYVGYELVQHDHDGEPPQQQYQDGDHDESPHTQFQRCVGEAIEGHPCTHVHEGSDVEE